ncbi:type IV pilus biogenesis protein PilM [Photobacterium indicum]|uniref:Pilus assembly protein PilM n=1 Tax=Photobacterium indicum TaxID=81447 RepID=A0A2T3L6K6_9GAMM|nr:type IV pilus assembly protein PilM [Photobacterium indicum]PSV45754.1 pilus assembly protein PilM [Photobacterium indicum]
MFRNPLSIGIDIGNHSVKAVALSQKKERLELAAYAEVVLTSPVINEQHSVDSTVLLSAIRKLKKSLPFGSKIVTLALPDSAVISKVIQLDTNLKEDEAIFAVSQALGSSSPFPVEELWVDFFPLESNAFPDATTTMPYQIFATRKETVDTRIVAIKKAGLSPKVMELQTHALLWLVEHSAEMSGIHEQWGVVDVGDCLTEFCIKPQNAAAYHREIAFGLRKYSSSPHRNTLVNDLYYDEPAMKESLSSDEIERFTQQLADQLKRQFQLYNSTHPRSSLKGIWLCGGGQHVISSELLQRLLGVEVELMNPFAHFIRHKKLEAVSGSALNSQFAVAAGLAIRGVNQ